LRSFALFLTTNPRQDAEQRKHHRRPHHNHTAHSLFRSDANLSGALIRLLLGERGQVRAYPPGAADRRAAGAPVGHKVQSSESEGYFRFKDNSAAERHQLTPTVH
jgi:hypothetical protein